MSVTHDEIRKVDYARSFDWGINFDKNSGLTSPFNNWFPAVEVDWNVLNIETKTFDVPLGNFSIPIGLGENNLRITFHDSYDHIIFNWLENWGKQIANRGTGIAPLESACKTIFIKRLSPFGDKTGNKPVLESRVYKIHPYQNLLDNLSQDSKAKVFSVDFKIVGRGK